MTAGETGLPGQELSRRWVGFSIATGLRIREAPTTPARVRATRAAGPTSIRT
jgi:hypothetical protein